MNPGERGCPGPAANGTLPGMTEPGSEPPQAFRGPFRTARVLTISAAHALHDTYTAFLAPLLALFIENRQMTRTGAGLLSVFLQSPSLLQPFIGHVADRVALRYFVILAPAVTAAMMSLLGIAPNYAVMALLLFVAGLSSASMHAVGPVMAGRVSGGKLGRGMGLWMVGGELGRTLGPIIIVTALRWVELEQTVWLMVLGLIVSGMLFVHLRRIPGRPAEDGPSLPWRAALKAMRGLLIPLSGIVMARVFMLSAITTYLPTFVNEEEHNLWLAGAALTLLEAAGVAGALSGGMISDHLGRRKVLFASLATTPLLIFAFLMADGAARVPLLLLMGFTALSVTPVIMALVQESFPKNRALANGIYMAMSFGLRSIAVLAIGVVGDFFTMRIAFAVAATLPLLALPLIARLPIQSVESLS